LGVIVRLDLRLHFFECAAEMIRAVWRRRARTSGALRIAFERTATVATSRKTSHRSGTGHKLLNASRNDAFVPGEYRGP
jgi:hypothetical protein